MTLTRRNLITAGALLLTGANVSAQSFDVVKIVNGFAVGGGADTICRRIAERLSHGYATSAVVESRTGAGGQIAVMYAKAAAPDGATLLLIPMFALGSRSRKRASTANRACSPCGCFRSSHSAGV